MDIHYPAIFEPQEPFGFFVHFIDIPEAITEGETADECMFNATEVLSLILEEYVEAERQIPFPTLGLKNARYIAHAKVQAALLVRPTGTI